VRKLTFAAINCNSLNQTSVKSVQEKKLYAILQLKSDIIFLSDIRLSQTASKNTTDNIVNIITTNPHCSYKPIFNSTKSKRGVGILVRNGCDLSDTTVIRDPDENYLLATLEDTTGKKLNIGSVYGPNIYCPEYFARLEADIHRLGNFPLILAGDWNCTVSSLPVNINPMVDLPNKRHSELLELLMRRAQLVDPFRFLHPEKNEYSYIPRNTLLKNRSRIDFFLVSERISEHIQTCEIDNTLLSKAFDHRAISLSFVPPPKKAKFNHRVDFDTINNPDTLLVVQTALIEAYKMNADPTDLRRIFPNINFDAKLGRIWTLLRETTPDPKLYPDLEPKESDIITRIRNIDVIETELREVDIPALQTVLLTCGSRIFYDSLINNVRNEVVSYQAFIRKRSKEFETNIVDKINLEKTKQPPDYDLLSELESVLTNSRDMKLDNQLKKFSVYEHLNEEKITPSFLRLARTGNTEKDLASIVDADGNPFENSRSRNQYIRNYYADVYREREPEKRVTVADIREFLGQDVLHTPQVRNAILSDEEKLSLETEISLQELDAALKDCRTNSAGGNDGINYGFLKKFWALLRIPLLNYAREAFETGELTDSFRTANIKLIPKKGDETNLKNWRPISLLNCSYKIISRAINNRLKKSCPKRL